MVPSASGVTARTSAATSSWAGPPMLQSGVTRYEA